METEEDRWLFHGEANTPGWDVSIDGKETKIYFADHAFAAVRVPKGRHVVEFTFKL